MDISEIFLEACALWLVVCCTLYCLLIAGDFALINIKRLTVEGKGIYIYISQYEFSKKLLLFCENAILHK